MEKQVSGFLVGLTIFIAVIVFVIMLTVGWVVGFYNSVIVASNDVDTQFAHIKTEYQRRADLIVNMAEVAKGYADFEQETLTDVIRMRGGNFQGGTTEEQMAEMNRFDSAISRLLVVFEKYPELRTVEQYNKLSDELKNTENRIQGARMSYNDIVRSYNIKIQQFPNNILAGMFQFKQKTFFENEPGTDKAPKLNMTR